MLAFNGDKAGLFLEILVFHEAIEGGGLWVRSVLEAETVDICVHWAEFVDEPGGSGRCAGERYQEIAD